MASQKYSTELQFYKTNSFDTETPFLDLDLSKTNRRFSSKIYEKRVDFNFKIHVINSPFLV